MRKRRTISVVIPVYYNEESLPSLFREVRTLESALRKRSLSLELIFVDDGSGDRSLKVLLDFKRRRSRTRVVKLTRNFGAVHASKTGLRFVTGDAFTVLAADLQDPPRLIPEMVDHWLDGSKFVICERIKRGDPLISRLFSRLYYILLRTFIVPGYPPGGFDMALMDRSILPHLIGSSKSVFTPLLTYWLGHPPVVIRYARPARPHGSSRWSFRKKLGAFLDVVFGFSITPIRLISALGGIISLASFVFGTSVVYHALIGSVPVRGFAALASLTAFLLGLVILMLGVIGEYLWRIFEETNRRPETVIDEVY